VSKSYCGEAKRRDRSEKTKKPDVIALETEAEVESFERSGSMERTATCGNRCGASRGIGPNGSMKR